MCSAWQPAVVRVPQAAPALTISPHPTDSIGWKVILEPRRNDSHSATHLTFPRLKRLRSRLMTIPATGDARRARSLSNASPDLARRSWVALLLVALGLNIGWELGHDGLYTCTLPAWRYLRAAGIDAALIAAVVWITRRWTGTFDGAFWALMAAALLGAAVAIEAGALATGYWAYTPAMTTLGPLGASPLVQLPATGVVTLSWSPASRRCGGTICVIPPAVERRDCAAAPLRCPPPPPRPTRCAAAVFA